MFLLSAAVAPINAAAAMFVWFLLVPVYLLRQHTEITVLGDEPA